MVHRVNTIGQANHIGPVHCHIWLAQWVRQSTFWSLKWYIGLAQWVRQNMLGQYISTLGQLIWLAQWASTLPHWVGTLGGYIASGKGHWASTLPHGVSTLGHRKYIGPGHYNIWLAHWVRQNTLGQYLLYHIGSGVYILGQHIGSGKAHWASTLTRQVGTLGQYIRLAH